MELRTWKANLKNLTLSQYEFLRELCRLSKNVYNEAVYNIRQHYFAEKTYLRYEANYYQMKDSENYILLGSNISQQSMRAADQSFKSFFALQEKAKKGTYETWKVQLPGYLPKDGFYPVVFSHAGESSFPNKQFQIPVSRKLREKYPKFKMFLRIPDYILDKKVHQISIVPKHNGRYFEARFVFEDIDSKICSVDSNQALGIDLGVNNFCTCATTQGQSFIVDGRKIKSINQWYNKTVSRLCSIKDCQKLGKKWTKQQYRAAQKRNQRINDYIYKTAKYIVNYCVQHHIGNIVVGYNDGFQDKVNLGRVRNQNFVMLPYGQLKDRLRYLCSQFNIKYVEQEESYTSKANFWGKDFIPVWNPLNPKQGQFTGHRTYRGLYKTDDGLKLNADVNGALNILRKSNVVSLDALYSRGTVQVPTRIRPS